MQARDIMTTTVITVGAETPVPAVARLLVERRISGVPVVDMLNRVVGIVTEGDLLRRGELGTDKRRARWLELFAPGVQLTSEYSRAHGRLGRRGQGPRASRPADYAMKSPKRGGLVQPSAAGSEDDSRRWFLGSWRQP